ncbi:MAG: DUF3127 domain-containing protein [Gemmatimonadota bacterium]|jgi:hypothetical protein
MDIAISGKVTQILEEQSGTSKNGPWRKQDFILETEDRYPKPVCITQWGDDIDAFGVTVGERLTAHVDIQSREYNGRWYTDVKAWRVTREDAAGSGPPPSTTDEPWPDPSTADPGDDGDDDLPF